MVAPIEPKSGVEKVTSSPPEVRLFWKPSLSRTVITEVDDPSAIIDAFESETVEKKFLAGPTVALNARMGRTKAVKFLLFDRTTPLPTTSSSSIHA